MRKGWSKKAVIDFCYVTDFVANGSFASLRENVNYIKSPDYAILVRLTDFTKDWKKDFVYVSKSSYEFLKKSSLEAGDLIMSNVGEPGIVFIVPNLGQPMTLGPNSILIRPNKGIATSKYLYYYFSSHKGNKQIDEISSGAAQKKFNKTTFRELEIPLPPLPEQQRIVSVLDEAFASIAQAKSNAKRNLVNASELFENYLQAVFRNKDDNWDVKNLEDICVLQRGFDLPKHLRTKGSFPLVSSNGITDMIDTWKVKSPGVVTGRSGTIGKVHYIKEDYWPLNTALYVKDFHGNNEKFVYYFLKQFGLGKYSSGAGVPTLNRNNVHNVKVYFPTSLSEQRAIVARLEALSAKIKKLEEIYQKKLDDYEELKKSILKVAFAGELKYKKELVAA